jgi:hypothetical protein
MGRRCCGEYRPPSADDQSSPARFDYGLITIP